MFLRLAVRGNGEQVIINEYTSVIEDKQAGMKIIFFGPKNASIKKSPYRMALYLNLGEAGKLKDWRLGESLGGFQACTSPARDFQFTLQV